MPHSRCSLCPEVDLFLDLLLLFFPSLHSFYYSPPRFCSFPPPLFPGVNLPGYFIHHGFRHLGRVLRTGPTTDRGRLRPASEPHDMDLDDSLGVVPGFAAVLQTLEVSITVVGRLRPGCELGEFLPELPCWGRTVRSIERWRVADPSSSHPRLLSLSRRRCSRSASVSGSARPMATSCRKTLRWWSYTRTRRGLSRSWRQCGVRRRLQ